MKILSHMAPKDALIVVVVAPLILVAMVISTVNVQVNLMATYEQVFWDNPYKAWLLACLPVLGSVSIKLLANAFENSRNQRRYIKSVYIVTACSLLSWTIAFSLVFNGIATSENALPASDAMIKLFQWLNGFTEMMAAASLFISLTQTLDIYFPLTQYKNPDFEPQKNNVTEAKADEDRAFTKHLESMRRLHTHENQRSAFIHEQEQALNKDITRHNDIHND